MVLAGICETMESSRGNDFFSNDFSNNDFSFPTTTSSSNSHHSAAAAAAASNSTIRSDQWRQYGEARRRDLIHKDQAEGGTSFHLHKKCRIERYFQMAERVTQQFRELQESPDLDDAFVMGHRLVAFLEVALPQHPEYEMPRVARLRATARRELAWIQGRMEAVALQMDEQALNDYVANDYVPELDDSSTESEAAGGWDVFDPFDLGDESNNGTIWEKPETDLTQETTDCSDDDRDANFNGNHIHPDFEQQQQPPDISENDVTVEFLELHDLHHDDIDIDDDHFLRLIADETVRYETDSEAVDSWAPDAASAVSSDHHSPTFDPARLVLREILRNKLDGTSTASCRMQPPK